jgi:hypothetical protein
MKSNIIAVFSVALALMVLAVPYAFGCTGWVTGGGQCITTDGRTIGSFGFNAMWDSKDPNSAKGEVNYVDLTTGMRVHVHVHTLEYLEVWDEWTGNKPSLLRFANFRGPCTINGEEGHYAYVRVEDRGEPGTNDRFSIYLDTGYQGGSMETFLLHGNIQTHKPTGGPT